MHIYYILLSVIVNRRLVINIKKKIVFQQLLPRKLLYFIQKQ